MRSAPEGANISVKVMRRATTREALLKALNLVREAVLFGPTCLGELAREGVWGKRSPAGGSGGVGPPASNV